SDTMARMGSLLVVTGPPGAGKSTLTETIALRMSPSVLVEGDAFFRFLRSGAIEPWLPESNAQNTAVTRAAGSAAGGFAQGGLHTVFDGVIGAWFLDEFLAATGLAALDYAVLLPPVETCVQRVLHRQNHGFTNEAAARHMHDEFTRRPCADRHVFREAVDSPDVLASCVLDARDRGDLTYPLR
ncbi:MAG: uncharacterized protein JWN62_2346, partial [Acidimicrobiales bacterium]|nr:uncharacterized protein [Acidimicrobiales bacterium]